MRVPIVYYHSIGGLPPQTLPADVFARHLDALDRLGVRTVTVAGLARGELPDGPVAALAFDDGLLDNATVAAPMLAERGHVGTFYVVPGHDGRTRWVDPGSGRWSDEPAPGFTVPHPVMGPAERRALRDLGMEIGSHTHSHVNLRALRDPDALEREVGGAKRALEAELGVPVTTFSYPWGAVSRAALRAVRRAGFEAAVGTIPGYVRPASPRWLWPRFLAEDPAWFEAVIAGRGLRPGPVARVVARAVARAAARTAAGAVARR